MIKKTGHIVKQKRTYSPDNLKARITGQIKNLLEYHKVTPKDLGFKPNTFTKLCNGSRDWNIRHFAMIIEYFKEEKGVDIVLNLNGNQKKGEDEGMSEWKELYKKLERNYDKLEKENTDLKQRISVLESNSKIQNP